jgi:hypothetical protein
MADKILNEDGTSRILQEDDASFINLETVFVSWMPVYPSVIKIMYAATPSGENA